jgi:hypothetical protein
MLNIKPQRARRFPLGKACQQPVQKHPFTGRFVVKRGKSKTPAVLGPAGESGGPQNSAYDAIAMAIARLLDCCARRLGDQGQAGRAYLATGGAQSPQQASQARQTLAGRRIMHRPRPQHRDHVWSYDFVEDRTHDGRRHRMLNVRDEFYARMPGDTHRAQAQGDRCDRRAIGPLYPARHPRSQSVR